MIIGGNFNVIATEIYMQIIGYANLEYASAMNVLLLIPSLFLFMVYRYYMKESDSYSKTNRNQAFNEDFKLSKIAIASFRQARKKVRAIHNDIKPLF